VFIHQTDETDAIGTSYSRTAQVGAIEPTEPPDLKPVIQKITN